ncbi:hypothetical protein P154DRAFT_554896 [Amniculicola lignicola CBS 123094]|uniref:DUF7924 domain-containing protein n=1 Tax=Amniculicola lignicola CBS 123094 TaxID=1392246 RepID=A0A6A5WCV2_9PLEO|nr:hypothetical protein P154DRAFT_554896 [Amniculicola lignicola CBS 123094]
MPMAPRPNSTSVRNRRQPATGPRKKIPIAKSTRRASTQNSARLQPPPTPLALTSQPGRTKWKPQQEDFEAEANKPKGVYPANQLRRLPPRPRHEFPENLKEDSDTETKPESFAQPPPTPPAQRRKGLRLKGADLIQTTPGSAQQAKTPKRLQEEDEVSHPSLEPFPKRVRTSTASARKPVRWKTITEARVDYWREKQTWPTEEQENTMDRFRDLVQPALVRKKSLASLRRKRSDASIDNETVSTRTPSDQQPREQKCAPYRHRRYEGQLSERGSFMSRYKGGISAKSKALCQRLLNSPQSPPKDTFFKDEVFEKVLESVKGRNETRVIRDIAQLIVPPAEPLAILGAEHLDPLRETTNAGWNSAMPFHGPRPQPDYSLGFKREAFTPEQLQKLQPFIGNELEDYSFIAATYDMYFPFLTSEVKCGASALDIADRQNAHSQTVALRGLITLFQCVGREDELHQEINGFSISHSDEQVRVWGHYAVINGKPTFYRHPIANFAISKTEQGDNRWTAYTFVRNIYDSWLPGHFLRICSVIDMLPADLTFKVSEQPELRTQDPEMGSSRSGLSQQLEDYDLADEGVILDSQPSVNPITPGTSIDTGSSNPKKKKTK